MGGLALILGLFLLANTRPFEGSLAVGLGLVSLFAIPGGREGFRIDRGRLARRLVPLFAVAIAITATWTGIYNHAVTGSALRLPYLEWSAQASPHSELHPYAGSTELPLSGKLDRLRGFYFGAVLTCVAPLALLRWRQTAVRRASFVLLVLIGVCVWGSKGWPHYLAPVTVLVLLMWAEALAALAELCGSRSLGPLRLGRLLVGVVLALHLGRAAADAFGRLRATEERSWALERQALLETLEADGEKHLVLVSYPARRSLHAEWVYNEADIDGAAVVWARDLGKQNAALLRHFAGRRVWRLRPSHEGAALQPLATGSKETVPGGVLEEGAGASGTDAAR